MVSFWSVPLLWPGRTVAILASGPSMSQAVADQVHAAELATIVVNETFRLAPWAQMLYAADEEWWRLTPDAHRFSGLKVTVGDVQGVLRLRNTGRAGFDPDPACLRTGINSGYQALHIAVHAGAARVLLCGFDMDGGHWHGPHRDGLKTTSAETYARFRAAFDGLAPILLKRGVDVVNVTPGSALKAFRQSTLEEELDIKCHAL